MYTSVADFNGDGNLDVCVIGPDAREGILLSVFTWVSARVSLSRFGSATLLMRNAALRLLGTSIEMVYSIWPSRTAKQWIFFLGTETARSKNLLHIKPQTVAGAAVVTADVERRRQAGPHYGSRLRDVRKW